MERGGRSHQPPSLKLELTVHVSFYSTALEFTSVHFQLIGILDLRARTELICHVVYIVRVRWPVLGTMEDESSVVIEPMLDFWGE